MSDETLPEKLCFAAGVYHFDTYGWMNHDEPDSRFMGHYFWAVQPPVSIDWIIAERHWVKQPKASLPEPDEWAKLLAVKGADFEGLMKAARMTLGMFLVEAEKLKANQFSDDRLYDLHYMSSLVYMATAAERIREFFVVAAFKQTQDQYHARTPVKFDGEKRSLFVTPIKEAETEKLTTESSDALPRMLSHISSIKELRDQRNELVHELATRIGKAEKNALENRIRRAAPEDFPWEKLKEWQDESERVNRQSVDAVIAKLAKWYNDLMKLSNEVFIFEYFQRRKPL